MGSGGEVVEQRRRIVSATISLVSLLHQSNIVEKRKSSKESVVFITIKVGNIHCLSPPSYTLSTTGNESLLLVVLNGFSITIR
jgi:hypothetical protein